MGQVFTWDAVRRKEVPTPDDFAFARSEITIKISAEPSILYALLFGSLARGDGNFRSDLDYLLVYDLACENEALRAIDEIRHIATKYSVPLNLLLVDSVVSGSRFHTFGPTLLRHFRMCVHMGCVLKGSDAFSFPTFSKVKEDVENYLRRKLRSLNETRSRLSELTEEEEARLLRKALEAPMHIARKMLEMKKKIGEDDSKRTVYDRYCECMSQELGEQLKHLIGLDGWYSAELAKSLEAPNELDYRFVVAILLQEAVPLAIEFVRGNIKYMST